jgi:hypothetical protein
VVSVDIARNYYKNIQVRGEGRGNNENGIIGKEKKE